VVNSGDKEMYFSIGGHPAFMIPKNKDGEQSVDNGSSLLIDDADVLNYKLIDENGLAVDDIKRIDLDNGYLPLSMDLFEKDALIVEKSGIRSVTLCNYEKVASLSVEFHTPVFGLWAPAGKESPFVCIEPWYGRCDGADFKGELCDREYGNKLPEGAEFSGGYDIIVEM
jgi:galactose mutarotase-like enzyme